MLPATEKLTDSVKSKPILASIYLLFTKFKNHGTHKSWYYFDLSELYLDVEYIKGKKKNKPLLKQVTVAYFNCKEQLNCS